MANFSLKNEKTPTPSILSPVPFFNSMSGAGFPPRPLRPLPPHPNPTEIRGGRLGIPAALPAFGGQGRPELGQCHGERGPLRQCGRAVQGFQFLQAENVEKPAEHQARLYAQGGRLPRLRNLETGQRQPRPFLGSGSFGV